MNKTHWLLLYILAWSVFILVTGLTVYVNYFLPHGPRYPTGEIVCQNDDRGPCGEEYKEDLRGLNIPAWAKFFRDETNSGLLIMGFAITLFYLFYKHKEISSKTNMRVSLGRDIKGKNITIDLQKESLHSIILTGETGSGKSILDRFIYKQLTANNNPNNMGFVFLDMTQVDFVGWDSPFLLRPTVVGDRAIDVFEELVRISSGRSKGTYDNNQAILIHIEECDLIVQYPERFEKSFLEFVLNKGKSNMYLVFSTSRPSPDVLTRILLKYADLKIVFKLSNKDDSNYLLGRDVTKELKNPGEKVIVSKDRYILSQPLSEQIVVETNMFDKEMTSSGDKNVLLNMDYGAAGYVEGYQNFNKGLPLQVIKRYKSKWQNDYFNIGLKMGYEDASLGKESAVLTYNPKGNG